MYAVTHGEARHGKAVPTDGWDVCLDFFCFFFGRIKWYIPPKAGPKKKKIKTEAVRKTKTKYQRIFKRALNIKHK